MSVKTRSKASSNTAHTLPASLWRRQAQHSGGQITPEQSPLQGGRRLVRPPSFGLTGRNPLALTNFSRQQWPKCTSVLGQSTLPGSPAPAAEDFWCPTLLATARGHQNRRPTATFPG